MVDSDKNNGESQGEVASSDISNDKVENNTSGTKRPREETLEDENLHVSSKKVCTNDEKMNEEKDKTEGVSKVNGNTEEMKEHIKDTDDFNEKENSMVKSVSEESIHEKTKETSDITNKSKDEEEALSSKDDIIDKQETMSENSVDNECKQKDNESSESLENADDSKKEKEIGEVKGKDNIEQKNKRKSHVEDSEVVEGLELSVECASDKESSSSSESENEKEKKHKPKTIIVKEKPNDSELDVSSSEAEKSDLQESVETKSVPKQGSKKGRKKGRTSFSKAKGTDSEDNNDNVSDDEDYSPRTKKRLKKAAANKKATKPPVESKRGRGKGRKPVKKTDEKEDVEEEKVEEDSGVPDDKKSEENSSDAELLKSNSEDESDSENVKKDEKKRRGSTKPEDDKKIQVLKKYIRAAGIRVKSYTDLWADCKSNAARVRCLKDLLEKNGITGRPTLDKCRKAKKKNETLKDIAELNTSNIISEGRVTRAQRSKDSSKETRTPQTPTKHREARTTLKRVLRVIDSDSE